MNKKQDDIIPGYIDDIELSWLAGLWEGEGHFGYDRTQLAHIRMTDKDIIIKAKSLIERTLNLPKPIHLLIQHTGRKNDAETFGFQTYGATARAIMRLLLPLLGRRRRAQIWRSLNEYRPSKLPQIILDRLGI